jgi:polyhydroxyalkanoate synthesis regulator phasin
MSKFNNKKEIGEAKALRWLANMFPFIDEPKDNDDKINNIINLYCTAGADKIEELNEKVIKLEEKVNSLERKYRPHYDYDGHQGGA